MFFTFRIVSVRLFLILLSIFYVGFFKADRLLKAPATKYISTGHAKVAIVGIGFVGSSAAYALMLKNIAAELILVDVNVDRCEGEVLDLSDALSFSSASKVVAGTLQDAAKADIIVITVGRNRIVKSDKSRLDLLEANTKIMSSIIKEMLPINPRAVILVVSNPVDVMTYVTQELSDLPRSQVLGSGTWLDTQRLRNLLSLKLGIAQESVNAFVLGEHGDSQFVGWSSACVAGLPLYSFSEMTEEKCAKYAYDTKKKAYEIIQRKGATFFGIGACVADICENIIFNQKRVMPVSSFHEEYGACLGMPSIVGENGLQEVLYPPLSPKEQLQLEKSAETLRGVIKNLEL